MAIKNWHPVQLGIFWLVAALFAIPVWIVLARFAAWLVGRYAYQDWFELIPTVLAFLVGFAIVGLGLNVTWKWLDTRQAKAQE
jgi:hypothetical protein